MSLLDDLVSYWPLNEASGNALDAHASNDLTDNNTVGSATGLIGNARDFTLANSESFSHADSADFDRGDTDFTGSVWVYLDSKPASDDMTILAKDENDAADRQYRLQWDQGNDRFQWFVFDGTGSVAGGVLASTIGAPSLATWYHIIFWHSATDNEVGIVVNGTAADTSSTTAAVGTGSAQFFIGRRDDVSSDYHWDGLIDECGLWGRLLTAGEKTRLYNGGSGLAYSSFGGSPWYYYAQQQVAS